MKAFKLFLLWSFSGIFLLTPRSFAEKWSGSMQDYGKGQFSGYLVTPTKTAKKPGALLMIHNWMGITDETKAQAQRFADLGYTVFAVDVYGKNVRPKDAAEASALAGKYKGDRPLFRERLKAGLEFLTQQKNVDAKKIAVLGYCFGGTGALELARSGAALRGVVSFHGGLDSPTPSDGQKIQSEVLAHHGAIDPFVKAEDLAAFEKEMKDNKVKYQLIKYEGAVHSFTEKAAGNDASKGAAYNEVADKKSFASTKDFLARVL